ncbi:endonuclease/exonuclease/phosphatase family protein [Martelella mangrovi]|uniref:Endonuclease/exonuclease/phosphatase family metal-dependent hydrolase n=1 Tax=Martelella mangrovi TaxID=1397477 RepID=A0ABV2IB71_9HYPH
MKIASYNIQFGIGTDGRYDLNRIAASLEGADIIALQEVTRGFPGNDGRDMVAEIEALFPGHFAAFGAGADMHLDFSRTNGRIVERRLQFGNMLLSRYPLLSLRHLLLPRSRTLDRLNYQRSALEGVVETPAGALRVYSTHLDHMSVDERLAQISFLRKRLAGFAMEGSAMTGGAEYGLADPPMAEDFILLGDFNMEPESEDYLAMAGRRELDGARNLRAGQPVDIFDRLGARAGNAITWTHPSFENGEGKWVDYVFVSPGLAPRIRGARVDRDAKGSDHFPLWVTLA